MHHNLFFSHSRDRATGFTLLEVLVGLAILAITFGVVLRTLHDRTATTEMLRLRLIARWVAQNQFAEVLLSASPLNDRSGTATQLGQTLHWSTHSDTSSPETKTYPVSISITDEKHAPILTYQQWVFPSPHQEEEEQSNPESSKSIPVKP